jgi:hypothetical protein
MGDGESYLIAFLAWWPTLSPAEQADYARANPPPSDWRNFYD